MGNRNKYLTFRVTEREKQIIADKANVKYDSVGSYLRDCALQKEIYVLPSVCDVADELRAIGNNLNQLTRAVNSGMINAVDLTEMRQEVADIWQLLNSFMQAYR